MFGMNVTDAQLIIGGLLSGGGVVAIVVKWLVTSPEREAAAYQRGLKDESSRCAEDIAALRAVVLDQQSEISKLRTGLLRLAVASDLTRDQRAEIADALGYRTMPVDATTPPPGNHPTPPPPHTN